MTGEEIANATPWEISKRIDGYLDRMKDRRIFFASFITAPVINSGVRSPKRGVKVEDLLPNDFRGEPDKEEAERIRAMIAEEEERRKHGASNSD